MVRLMLFWNLTSSANVSRARSPYFSIAPKILTIMFDRVKQSNPFSARGKIGAEPKAGDTKLLWAPINEPSTKDALLSRLLGLYWAGVRREIKHILLSLIELQELGQSQFERENEGRDIVCGFETFIDQISLSSRQHAEEYGT